MPLAFGCLHNSFVHLLGLVLLDKNTMSCLNWKCWWSFPQICQRKALSGDSLCLVQNSQLSSGFHSALQSPLGCCFAELDQSSSCREDVSIHCYQLPVELDGFTNITYTEWNLPMQNDLLLLADLPGQCWAGGICWEHLRNALFERDCQSNARKFEPATSYVSPAGIIMCSADSLYLNLWPFSPYGKVISSFYQCWLDAFKQDFKSIWDIQINVITFTKWCLLL